MGLFQYITSTAYTYCTYTYTNIYIYRMAQSVTCPKKTRYAILIADLVFAHISSRTVFLCLIVFIMVNMSLRIISDIYVIYLKYILFFILFYTPGPWTLVCLALYYIISLEEMQCNRTFLVCTQYFVCTEFYRGQVFKYWITSV